MTTDPKKVYFEVRKTSSGTFPNMILIFLIFPDSPRAALSVEPDPRTRTKSRGLLRSALHYKILSILYYRTTLQHLELGATFITLVKNPHQIM